MSHANLKKYLRSTTLQLVLVFLLAFSVRMEYLREIRGNPFFENLTLDQTSYDTWAMRIAGGEWLGKEIFYQDPLYPYFLGTLYAAIGRNLLWVRIVQVFIGSLTCVLIYVLGKSLFNKSAGMVAGLLAAFYMPFIYFDTMILKTFLGVFLICLFLVLLILARPRQSLLLWISAGVVLGILALVRANTLALAPAVLLWLYLVDRQHETARYRVIASGGFLAGLLFVISVVCTRNYVVGKDFVLLTSQAGQNFYIGNNAKNLSGRYQPPDFIRPNPRYEQEDFRVRAEIVAGKKLRPSEVSAYWFKKSFAFIKGEPVKWLNLMWTKFRRFWNWYEVPDNQNYYFFSRYSRIQRLPLFNFRLVAALGLTGMVLFLPQWRRLFLLYMTVLLYSITVIAFYIFARYRLPVVPPLILFAAFFLTEMVQRIFSGKWKKPFAAAVLCFLFLHLLGTNVRPEDYFLDNANAYCRLAGVYESEGDWDSALTAYQRAVEIMPHYWAAYYGLGQVYSRKRLDEPALENYLKARMYSPGNPDICMRIGFFYYIKKDFANSIKFYKFAAELKPDWSRPYYWLAILYEEQGDAEQARVNLKKFRELQWMNQEGH